jgi:hypothetical protein
MKLEPWQQEKRQHSKTHVSRLKTVCRGRGTAVNTIIFVYGSKHNVFKTVCLSEELLVYGYTIRAVLADHGHSFGRLE